MIGGAVLAAWIPLWNFISFVSTVDFMRTSSGRPGIGTLFLPRGIADGATVLGIGGMVYAFILLAGKTRFKEEKSQQNSKSEEQQNETDEERRARVRLYEFFQLCAPDLYRTATNFGNLVQTKLGDDADLRGCLAGTLRDYTERDFVALFTKLSALIPPHPEASGKEPLCDLETAFYHLMQSYDCWARWTQKAALLVPIEIDDDTSYQDWNRADIEFLLRLRETTATTGLHWLNQQTKGLVRDAFRIRNLESSR